MEFSANKNQDGGLMFTSPDCSSSASPIDLVSRILNDDFEDFDPRGQRPSDEDEEVRQHHAHLPLFKRGTSNDNYRSNSVGGSTPMSAGSSSDLSPPNRDLLDSPGPFFPDLFRMKSVYDNVRSSPVLTFPHGGSDVFSSNPSSVMAAAATAPFTAYGNDRSSVPKFSGGIFGAENQVDDLDILNQAVSLAAMSLKDRDSLVEPLASQQALANIAALAQIDDQIYQRHQKFGRQYSLPPEVYSPPPMFGRNNMATATAGSAFGGGAWQKNDSSFQGGTFSNGFFNGIGSGGRPPLRHTISSPIGDLGERMQIRSKFGSLGDACGQFNAPHGFCLGPKEEIVVADTYNHRIQIFDKFGNFMATFGRPGKENGFLWHPRKVAVLPHNGHFVVCDRGVERSRMQIFNDRGEFIHRICIRFVHIAAGLATTSDGLVVVVDSVSRTIFMINPETGNLVGCLDCSGFMNEPSDIAIFRDDFYVCDFKGHAVVVISREGKLLRKIPTDFVSKFPNGIDISGDGDILVGDSHGNQFHVAIFDYTGKFVSHFHCPQVKVSRCCGLKLTSEGFIVTLAKNNHHALVLNALFVD